MTQNRIEYPSGLVVQDGEVLSCPVRLASIDIHKPDHAGLQAMNRRIDRNNGWLDGAHIPSYVPNENALMLGGTAIGAVVYTLFQPHRRKGEMTAMINDLFLDVDKQRQGLGMAAVFATILHIQEQIQPYAPIRVLPLVHPSAGGKAIFRKLVECDFFGEDSRARWSDERLWSFSDSTPGIWSALPLDEAITVRRRQGEPAPVSSI